MTIVTAMGASNVEPIRPAADDDLPAERRETVPVDPAKMVGPQGIAKRVGVRLQVGPSRHRACIL